MNRTASTSGPSIGAAAERYHAIDALRALAMFLGVVLHASLSFMHEANIFTPKMDRSRFVLFDLGVYGVHAFRMQLFFVVAGFFTALLLARRTPREFLMSRLMRLGLPLIIGGAIIIPLTIWPFLHAHEIPPAPALLYAKPVHLWFLIYLCVFSAAACMCAVLARCLPRDTFATPLNILADAAASRWALPLLAIPTVLVTMLMSGWFIETPWQWIPQYPTLIYYGFFFTVGWAVQRRGVVTKLGGGRSWMFLLPASLLILFPAMVWVGQEVPATAILDKARTTKQQLAIIGAATIQALFTWGMILGLFGLFGRICAANRAWVRWLADSSYCVYLLHLPAVYWLQYLLADFAIPGMQPGPLEACLKFAAILTAVIAFCLLTYALVVRPTILERVIGGGGSGSPSRASR